LIAALVLGEESEALIAALVLGDEPEASTDRHG
jgi:hypothetical protein